MRVHLERHAQLLPLAGCPVAGGGEAAIFEMPGQPRLLAKIYHKPTHLQAAKLAAMLLAPPADPMAPNGHASIAWPLDRLLADDGSATVLGFVMPRVDGALPIFEFYNPRSRLRLCPHFHYGYLLRTARNLAAAVRALHERDYVLGDLNETNVLVNNQALVTLVDTDSFQVSDGGRVFRCPVGKPEYTPPELQRMRFADFDRGPEHDAFALAVLIFQLLMQGIHPFAGRFTGTGEPAEIAERIALGHWPYTPDRQIPYRPNPFAPPFATLPPAVQDLMQRCFEEGHVRSGRRPTAAEWQQTLRAAEDNLATCTANAQHLFHESLPACPWCELGQRLRRDPFPSRRPEAEGAAATTAIVPAAPVSRRPSPLARHLAPPPTPPPPPRPPSPPFRPVPLVGPAGLRRRNAVPFPPPPRSTMPRWLGALAALALLVVIVWAGIGHGFLGWLSPSGQASAPPSSGKAYPPGELRRFEGHKDSVSSVAVSPNGRLALSGSQDNTLILWDLETGRQVRPFKGHTNAVAAVAISPDGRQALSGSADMTVRVWDLASGQETAQLRGHTAAVESVAFSPDGHAALSGSSDGTIRLWDLFTGLPKHQIDQYTSPVFGVAFSPNGRLALSANADYTVRLWDLAEERQRREFAGHTDYVRSVAFAADGRRALSGADDGTVRLWDVETGRQLCCLKGHQAGVWSVAFTPDGRRALSAGKDGTLRVWALPAAGGSAPGSELGRLESPDGELLSVVCVPDGLRALSGGADNLLRLWGLPAASPR
jgi:WD40 repeat protein/serine/threonine protein kinase